MSSRATVKELHFLNKKQDKKKFLYQIYIKYGWHIMQNNIEDLSYRI